MLDAPKILKKLGIDKKGKYENQFYVVNLENSDEYAKMYTLLGETAINTEYPSFGVNTNNTTTKITNYFETDVDNQTYNIFLMADFDNERYYIKIGEK